ncbi:Set6p [Sporobolomyces koalae]|uniref:Set6p n=1 Tax=Sporobolomyces koalae TaxID=500713 RepID=UPI003173C50F
MGSNRTAAFADPHDGRDCYLSETLFDQDVPVLKGMSSAYKVKFKMYELQKQNPVKLVPTPRKTLLREAKEARGDMLRNHGNELDFLCMPRSTESSKTAFNQLKPINLGDMLVPHTHKGRYIIVRSISALCTNSFGVQFVVEDTRGRAISIALYHFEEQSIQSGHDLDLLFPLGTILAIREPHICNFLGASQFCLRIFSPTDVVLLGPADPMLEAVRWSTRAPPAVYRSPKFDHRAHGNSAFKGRKYQVAKKFYDDGLASPCADSERLLLLLNPSQTHLNLNHPFQALQDAEAALVMCLQTSADSSSLSSLRAKMRRSKALENRRMLEQALSSYEEAVCDSPDNREAQEGRARVQRKLTETKTGQYDLQNLLFGKPDVGDYVASTIGIDNVPHVGGGRGVFAKKRISAGDLLMVEKSFARGRGRGDSRSRAIGWDLALGLAVNSANIDLVSKIVNTIVDDPASARAVHCLYGGPQFQPNCRPSFDPLAPSLPTDMSNVFVDSSRIEAIQAHNQFSLEDLAEGTTEMSFFDFDPNLFSRSSIFNHSCAPNATWYINGDVIVIRARTDISQDEEVTLSYLQVGLPYEVRHKIFVQKFEFECTCSRCKDDRKAGTVQLARRSNILRTKYEVFDPDLHDCCDEKDVADKLSDIVTNFESTYPSTNSIGPEAVRAYHDLSTMLCPIHDRSQRQSFFKKALNAEGVHFVPTKSGKLKVTAAPFNGPNSRIMRVIFCYIATSAHPGGGHNPREGKAWLEFAIELDQLTTGRKKKDFRMVWSSEIEELGSFLTHFVDRYFENA